MTEITSVVLCGGSGTRLWPLSRQSFPKQFVPLVHGKCLLKLTLERVAFLGAKVICVGSEDHRFMVSDAMESAGVKGQILLEPFPRNTAAAMAIAAMAANKQDLLLFCPSDHYIPDLQAFKEVVSKGVNAAKDGFIVTFGIRPHCPSTAYGYIQQGKLLGGDAFKVDRFFEKPDSEFAQNLFLSAEVL